MKNSKIMHHKNEVTKIMHSLVAGQGLDISSEINKIHQIMDDIEKKSTSLNDISGYFYDNIFYHPENEGAAKTFRNVVTNKWYYEHELLPILGIINIGLIKNKYPRKIMERIDFKSKRTKRFLSTLALTIIMFVCWALLNRVYQYLIPWPLLEIIISFGTLFILLWQTMKLAFWIQEKYKI